MAPASIRVRLTAWYSRLLMVTLAVLGVAVYVLMARALLNRVDAMLDFEFQEAAERLMAGEPAVELASMPAAFHQTYFLRISRPDGSSLAQSPKLSGHIIPVPPSVQV